MKRLFLELKKRWLERHIEKPFNKSFSLKLDSVVKELDSLNKTKEKRNGIR